MMTSAKLPRDEDGRDDVVVVKEGETGEAIPPFLAVHSGRVENIHRSAPIETKIYRVVSSKEFNIKSFDSKQPYFIPLILYDFEFKK